MFGLIISTLNKRSFVYRFHQESTKTLLQLMLGVCNAGLQHKKGLQLVSPGKKTCINAS